MNNKHKISLVWAAVIPTLLMIVLAAGILISSGIYFSHLNKHNSELTERFRELDTVRRIYDTTMHVLHAVIPLKELSNKPARSETFRKELQSLLPHIQHLSRMPIVNEHEKNQLELIHKKILLINEQAALLSSIKPELRHIQAAKLEHELILPMLRTLNDWYEYELVEVEKARKDADANMTTYSMFMVILTISIFAALVYTFLYIHKKFTLRIMQVRTGTQELSKGNLSYRFIVKGSDEISQVATDINIMAKTLQQSQEKLQKIAKTDTLTGIMNRRAMDEIVSHEMARSQRSGNTFALLLVDIDHFKKINDTYGHATGDAVLIHITETLGNVIRQSDYVFRLGGEEFVIFMSDCPIGEGIPSAERIRMGIELSEYKDENFNVHLTASIGVIESFGARYSIDQLLRLADEAMYKAKELGRNRCQLSTASVNHPP